MPSSFERFVCMVLTDYLCMQRQSVPGPTFISIQLRLRLCAWFRLILCTCRNNQDQAQLRAYTAIKDKLALSFLRRLSF